MRINFYCYCMDQALSPAQVKEIYKRLTGKDINIVMYDDIINSSSLDQLFNKYGESFIIYYPYMKMGNSSYGHYVALVRLGRSIYFYDPLGDTVDHYKKSSVNRDELYPEDENTLVKHLLEQMNKGYKIDYSHHKHQSKNPDVATCGRHSLFRCANSRLSNDDYDKLLKYMKHDNSKYMDHLIMKLTG